MRFSVDGVALRGGRGAAAPIRRRPRSGRGTACARSRHALEPGVRARFDRWYGARHGRRARPGSPRQVRFVDLAGRTVDPDVVDSVTLSGSNGERRTFRGATTGWLQGNRVVPESGGRQVHARLVRRGAGGRRRGRAWSTAAQQRFFPAKTPEIRLRLLLFSARFEVHDALLGFPIGSAVQLRFPDGRVERYAARLRRRGHRELAPARRLPGQRRRAWASPRPAPWRCRATSASSCG